MKPNENKIRELLQIEKLDIGNNLKKYKSDIYKKKKLKFHLKDSLNLNTSSNITSVNNFSINVGKLKKNFSKNSTDKERKYQKSKKHSSKAIMTQTNPIPNYTSSLTNQNRFNADLYNFNLYDSTINNVNSINSVNSSNQEHMNIQSYSKVASKLQLKEDGNYQTYSLKDKLLTFVKSDGLINKKLKNEILEGKKTDLIKELRDPKEIKERQKEHRDSYKESVNKNETKYYNTNFTNNTTKDNTTATHFISTTNTSTSLRKSLKRKLMSSSNNSSMDLNIGTKNSNNCSDLSIIHSELNRESKRENYIYKEKIKSVENKENRKIKFINLKQSNESHNLIKTKLKKNEKNELEIRKRKFEILLNKNSTVSQRFVLNSSNQLSLTNSNITSHLENLHSLSHFNSNNLKVNRLTFNSLLSQQYSSLQQNSKRKNEPPTMMDCISISNPILQASIFPDISKSQGLLNFGSSAGVGSVAGSILNGNFGGYRLIKEMPKEIILKKKKLNTGLKINGSSGNLKNNSSSHNIKEDINQLVASSIEVMKIPFAKSNTLDSESFFDERIDIDRIRATNFNNKFIKIPKDLEKIKIKNMFKNFGSVY